MLPEGKDRRFWGWLAGFALAGLALWQLHSILLPFVAGLAIAYLLDPVARRLQKLGLSRLMATAAITLGFFGLAVAAILLLLPLIEGQVVSFIQNLPAIGEGLSRRAQPLWQAAAERLAPEDIERIRNAAGNYAGTLVNWVVSFFSRLLTGSLVVINILSLIFITPIVTFYLLRDWGELTKRIKSWLPREHAAVIRAQLAEIDRTLAGFLRGQALVCLILGLFYAIGLTATGLNLGLIVGFSAGFLSFIPYLGSISGFVVGVGLALAQSPDWTLPALVAGVFVVGNVIEGNYLSPKLVGEQIGLHPVWVMFALLAGGALFGFLGMLLALPVAAVVGVVARFLLQRYLASSYYRGDGGGG